jgi:hypothetical protein
MCRLVRIERSRGQRLVLRGFTSLLEILSYVA